MNETVWQSCCGPIRTVGRLDRVDGELRHIRDVVTVGNRVKASWQDYGHMLGTATVVGFEVEPASGWVKVMVRADRPDSLLSRDAEDPYVARWDWDRTERVPGHWDGETQEQSVGRWLAYLRGLDIDAQIRDRLDGLRRVLNDPGLSDAMKAEEVACAHARIEFLESARPLADALNVVADLAATPGGE